MLTGENGILGKATTAKSKNDESSVEEKIKLSVMYARMNTNGDTNINLDELEKELEKNFDNVSISKKGANEALPWRVTNNGYMFEITENGEVKKVNGIALDKSNIKLLQSGTETITAELTQGVTGTITWTSGNPSIARVDSSGNVTAVGSGETTITATIEGTDYSATCEVKVVLAITSLILADAEVESGNTVQLEITKIPSEGETENIIFQSSNEDVATVDNNGLVTAKKGITEDTEVTIIAKPEKTTGKEAKCKVTVKKEDESNKIVAILNKSDTKFANNNNIREVREGNIPIPTGFYYIKGSIIGGAVITDDATGVEGKGNEFVWIPVKNIGEMAKPIEGTNNYRGVLYNFNSNNTQNSEIAWTADCREPLNYSECDNADNVTGWTETLYQEEYDKMVKQVEKYQGFYVGRYEMSLNSNTGKAQSKGEETSAKDTDDANKYWYGLYTKAKTYAPDTQENTKSVVSSMIWGSQYDAMMRWMQNNGVDVTEEPTDTPSSTLQNAVRNTGEITGGKGNKDVINNVYDLLGNRLEWTQEADSSWGARRVLRGGKDCMVYSLSSRNNCPPTYEEACGGCRFTLYIK